MLFEKKHAGLEKLPTMYAFCCENKFYNVLRLID
jgi:hypothetical protein